MPTPLRPDFDAAPFSHPADAMDGEALPVHPILACREDVEDVFREIFYGCLPKSQYTGERAWKAGYKRMIAIAYVVAPEVLGSPSQEQAAAQLGVHVVTFRRLMREAEATLAMRALAARNRSAQKRF